VNLPMLTSFALTARLTGGKAFGPDQSERAQQIDGDFSAKFRESHARSLARLDELRAFPKFCRFCPNRRDQLRGPLRAPSEQNPSSLRKNQVVPAWVPIKVTNKAWDPVTQRSVM